MVTKYQDIFVTENRKVGKVTQKEFELKLKLKEGAKPVAQNLRPMHPKVREALKKQVEDWAKERVIERSKSPWSSPLVPVHKKDGSWRFCIDYRVLNSNLEPFLFPAPNVEDILAGIGKKELFLQLDSSQAYLSVPLAA